MTTLTQTNKLAQAKIKDYNTQVFCAILGVPSIAELLIDTPRNMYDLTGVYEVTDKDHARAQIALATPNVYESYHSFKFGNLQMRLDAYEVPGAGDDGEWTVIISDPWSGRLWGTYYIDPDHYVWGVGRNDFQVIDPCGEVAVYLRYLAGQRFHSSTVEEKLWEEN